MVAVTYLAGDPVGTKYHDRISSECIAKTMCGDIFTTTHLIRLLTTISPTATECML